MYVCLGVFSVCLCSDRWKADLARVIFNVFYVIVTASAVGCSCLRECQTSLKTLAASCPPSPPPPVVIRPNIGGVSNRSRNGAPSRNGCVAWPTVKRLRLTTGMSPPPSLCVH